MITTNKIKWFGSIILAGIILTLAMTGGKWGTSYSASASVDAIPVIDFIDPSSVLAGSPYIIMIINGENFGDMDDTRVRLTAVGFDEILPPLTVLPDGISVVIPAELLIEPKLYTVTVVKSTVNTVPTIPITPWDEESNPVPFTVYEGQHIYLPLINKK